MVCGCRSSATLGLLREKRGSNDCSWCRSSCVVRSTLLREGRRRQTSDGNDEQQESRISPHGSFPLEVSSARLHGTPRFGMREQRRKQLSGPSRVTAGTRRRLANPLNKRQKSCTVPAPSL